MKHSLFLLFCTVYLSGMQQQPKTLILQHDLNILSITNQQYDANNQKLKKKLIVVKERSCVLNFITNPNTTSNYIKFLLPCSPEKIYLNLNNEKVSYGDCIKIEDNYTEKTISLYNITTSQNLAILPKRTKNIHLGSKSMAQENKIIFFINKNLPFVIIKKITYQNPLFLNKTPFLEKIKKSQHLCSSETNLRKEEIISLNINSEKTKAVRTAIEISIPQGLQKIKIHPNYDTIEPADMLTIALSPDNSCINILKNYSKEPLARIYTAKAKMII